VGPKPCIVYLGKGGLSPTLIINFLHLSYISSCHAKTLVHPWGVWEEDSKNSFKKNTKVQHPVPQSQITSLIS